MGDPSIAIIGGSGVYDPSMFEEIESVRMTTPFGPPSGSIEVGKIGDQKVAFLARHGPGHSLPPHSVPYRANIWALKELGVERIISPSAVGSLREDHHPGELVIVDQFIDFTKKRNYTFYDGGRTYHPAIADPFCPQISGLVNDACDEHDIPHHSCGTYACIEGPRFSTRAESRMYQQFAEVIGMTLVPECQLARELDICYTSMAMITDYDVWAERPVKIEEILATMGRNLGSVKNVLETVIPQISAGRSCDCHRTSDQARL